MMSSMMKTVLSKLRRDETGQAFILVLILLVLGGLIITPLLGFMSTGLIAGQLNEKRLAELYAADAGVEHAIWQVKTKAAGLPLAEGDPAMTYSIADVNGKQFEEDAIVIEYINEVTYRIESTATTDASSSTTIESYISILDFTLFTDNAITSMGDVTLQPSTEVIGDVQLNNPPIQGNPAQYTIDGDVSTEEIVGWPEAGGLSGFYQDDLDDNYSSYTTYADGTVIDVTGINNIGPLYCEGDLTIQTSNQDEEVWLQGTVYVAGDLDFRQTGKRYDIHLNGMTIFAEGEINIPAGKCHLYGPGCIIAVGDVTFQPNMEGEEFIFVMSVEGTTNFQPNGDFTGSIAGNVEVNLQPGGTLTWTEPVPFLNLPGADDSKNVISAIRTWEIDLT